MKETIWDKIRYKYWDLVPYEYRPRSLYRWLKCWLFKRYTTIKPRYLDHQWHDRMVILPHVMFEILSQFIEQECSPGHIDWEASGHMVKVHGKEVNVRDEMQTLYDWWHKVYNGSYPAVYEELWEEAKECSPTSYFSDLSAGFCEYDPKFKTEEDKMTYHRIIKAIRKLERQQERELAENMHRVVNLMPYLWT